METKQEVSETAPEVETSSLESRSIGNAREEIRDVPNPILRKTRCRKNTIATLEHIKKKLNNVCDLCGKGFRRKSDVYQHKMTHGEPLDCDKCPERFFKPRDLMKHKMETHSDLKIPTCEICGKTFTDGWRLLRHIRTHSNEKKFKCDKCDRAFSESGNLGKHIKQVHSKIRPFKCDTCDKSFPQKKDLQGHMYIHTLKRYACLYCKKDFLKAKERRFHEKTVHTNVTEFSCAICNAIFSSKINLYNHKIIHRERNFPCLQCQKKFHTTARLRKHMQSHKVEDHSRCEICDKSFSQECNLKRHIECMHMRDDCFFCLHCSQTFSMASELRMHRNTEHMNERPFKCSVCEKAFFHAQSLGNHIRCHKDPNRHIKEFIIPIKQTRKDSQIMNMTRASKITQSNESKSSLVESINVNKKRQSKTNMAVSRKKFTNQLFNKIDTNLPESVNHGTKSLNASKKSRSKLKKTIAAYKPELSQNPTSSLAEQSEFYDPTIIIKQEEDLIDIGPTVIMES